MPRGYPVLNEEQKQEIIERIKNGSKVSDLAKEYGVNPKNIYNLLGKKANQPNAQLELAKIKRENDALLRIIGQLVARQGKKNQYGRAD